MSFQPPERFNIASYFLDDRVAEGRGERIALEIGDATHTYADVQAAANRFANVLAGLDVRPEERVMIALPDGADWVAAFFGILKLGAVVVMVNPHFKQDYLTGLFDYVRPEPRRRRRRRPPDLRERRCRRGPPTRSPGGRRGRGQPRRATRTSRPPCRASSATSGPTGTIPAIWLFSGGTTGLPKGVVQSHASFANTTELYAKASSRLP